MPSLPTPFYAYNGITIYNADCRDILPLLKPVNLVLTDPPYGLGKRLHDGGTWSTAPKYDAMLSWDTQPADPDLVKAVVSMAPVAIVWGGHLYSLPPSRGWLVWKKLNSVPTMADVELAWTNMNIPARCFDFRIHPDGVQLHPTQKPLALMKWCLSLVPDAQIVMDPFMGVGTTLRAAKDLGRKAIGIEIEKSYCEIAVERLRQEVLL